MTIAKCIIRYLIGTISHGLQYPKLYNFELNSFLDIDYAAKKDDRKKTSHTCQHMGNSHISCNSKKQN